ncbi:MAG: hypothetical protein GX683_06670 [Ruminococcaceae bacterium]|nr:hypothetical protein [Oscillospiraceae bacterium]
MLLYLHEYGGHYVTIDYDADSPMQFSIYNYTNSSEKETKALTLHGLYEEGSFPVIIYTIKSKETTDEK